MKKTQLLPFFLGAFLGALVAGLIVKGVYQSETKTSDAKENVKVVYECPKDPAEEELPAPAFHKNIPKEIETNFEGEARVQWEEVPYAVSYHIRLYNEKGNIVRTWKTSRTIIYLKQVPFRDDLDWTPYKLTIASVNKLNLIGPESESKVLRARRLKNLMAPKIDSIVIED